MHGAQACTMTAQHERICERISVTETPPSQLHGVGWLVGTGDLRVGNWNGKRVLVADYMISLACGGLPLPALHLIPLRDQIPKIPTHSLFFFSFENYFP